MVSLRRPHYAWIICLGGALSLFAVMGMGINVFSVYQPYIIQLNGFSNAQGSWITTTRSLFTLAAMLTVNQLCARIGLRLVMTLGVVLLALSCFCFGLADSFPLYCAAGALTGLAYGYGGMVPLSGAVGHWFRDRRGLALGLAAAGSGVSTIFVPTLITGIIQAHGMRAAFLLEGLAVLVLGLLVFLLVRDVPGDLGLEPYHLGGPETPAPPPRPAPAGMTPALRLSLLLAVFLIGGPGGPGFSHLTVLYTTAGYDSASAALLISYLGLVICVSKILCGQIYDRFGSRAGNWYVHLVFLAGLLLCCLAHLGGMLPAFAAMTLFGLGLPISAVTFAIWSADLFRGRPVRGVRCAPSLCPTLLGCSSSAPSQACWLTASTAMFRPMPCSPCVWPSHWSSSSGPTESWTQDTGPAGIGGPSPRAPPRRPRRFRDSHRSRIGIFRARWLIASSSGETPPLAPDHHGGPAQVRF